MLHIEIKIIKAFKRCRLCGCECGWRWRLAVSSIRRSIMWRSQLYLYDIGTRHTQVCVCVCVCQMLNNFILSYLVFLDSKSTRNENWELSLPADFRWWQLTWTHPTSNLQFALSHSLSVSCDTACGSCVATVAIVATLAEWLSGGWRLSLDTASVIQRTKLWLHSPLLQRGFC